MGGDLQGTHCKQDRMGLEMVQPCKVKGKKNSQKKRSSLPAGWENQNTKPKEESKYASGLSVAGEPSKLRILTTDLWLQQH